MSDIQILVAKAKKALLSADLLIQNDDFEAAISRTYYSMYYITQAILLSENITVSTHKGMVTLFSKYFIRTGLISRSLVRDLADVFEKRQVSDYDFTIIVTKEKAESVLYTGIDYNDKIVQYLVENGCV